MKIIKLKEYLEKDPTLWRIAWSLVWRQVFLLYGVLISVAIIFAGIGALLEGL